jgi:uncharacterized protein YjbJ (UPF0337 family)
MNKDQIAGRIDEVKGKVKEVADKIVGAKELEVKGKFQHASGNGQAGYGDLKADTCGQALADATSKFAEVQVAPISSQAIGREK